MDDKNIAFNNLSILIEDTEILMNGIWFNNYNQENFFVVINEYFNKYEYKPNIIRGITSTVEFTPLLKNKHKHLKSLLNQLNKLSDKIIIKKVIDDNNSFFDFSIKTVIENRLTPLLNFVLNEIELCLNEKNITIKKSKNSDHLNWHGNKSALIELTKALIENGNLKGKQEVIFEKIQVMFNTELKNIDQAITKFNSRSQQNETKFLDDLKNSLSQYIRIKINKKF